MATEKTGVPREIIADHGSDLKLGIEKFCNQHKETVIFTTLNMR